jgi:ribosomal protein S18 acetylase RimI-like enzyme
MRSVYFDRETRGIVDLVDTSSWCGSKTFLITRINVPPQYRRRGVATSLLQQVLADADKEGVTLWLEVLSSGDMTDEQLGKWYEKFGFVEGLWTEDRKCLFYRRLPR